MIANIGLRKKIKKEFIMLSERDIFKNRDSVMEIAVSILKPSHPTVARAIKRDPSLLKKHISKGVISYKDIEDIFRRDVDFNKNNSWSLPVKFTWYLKCLVEGVGPFMVVCDDMASVDYYLPKRDERVRNFYDLYNELKGIWVSQDPSMYQVFEGVSEFCFPATEIKYIDLDWPISIKLYNMDKKFKRSEDEVVVGDDSLEQLECDVNKAEDLDCDDEDDDEDFVRDVDPEVSELISNSTKQELTSMFVMSLGFYVFDMVYSRIFTEIKKTFDYEIHRVPSGVVYTFGDKRHSSLAGFSDDMMLSSLTSASLMLKDLRGELIAESSKLKIINADGYLYNKKENPVFFSSITGITKIPRPEFFSKLIIGDPDSAKKITMNNFRMKLKRDRKEDLRIDAEIERLSRKYMARIL